MRENNQDEEKEEVSGVAAMQKAKWPSTSFSLLAVMFGATQLAYSLGQMGWGFGLGIIGLSGISTWVSGILIGRAAMKTGARSYPELGKKAFGKNGHRTIVTAQWMSYFLTGMTQIAFSGAGYQQTFKGTKLGHTFCTEGWMLITVCLLTPCAMVPSFDDAVGMAVIVVSVQCFGLAIMYSQIATNGRYSSQGLCYDQYTSSSVLATVANTAFAFGGHGVIPELIREMKEPKHFERAFNVAYGFTVPMYILSGAVGFWAWGNASSANFVENLQSTPWVHAYNWINTVATFPLVVINQVALFLNVELSFGILPTDTWINSNRREFHKTVTDQPTRLKKSKKQPSSVEEGFAYRPLCAPQHTNPFDDDYTYDDRTNADTQTTITDPTGENPPRDHTLDEDEDEEPSAFAVWLWQFPPILVRGVFRTGYIFAMYCGAYALIGVGLGNLTDLTGALGICALTYWMPFVIHAKVFWREYSMKALAWNGVNIAFGLFVSIAGTYFAAKDLFSGSFTFFKETSCKEGAYFWGNSLWGAHDLHPASGNHSASAAYDIVVDGCCMQGKTCGQ